MRTLVRKDSRNHLRRNFSDVQFSMFSDITFSMFAAGVGAFGVSIAAYSSFGFWFLRYQLRPLQNGIDKLGVESKERTDKLEMKIDRLSKEIRDSNDKINSRVDSVLLRSLDLQRRSKPAGE